MEQPCGVWLSATLLMPRGDFSKTAGKADGQAVIAHVTDVAVLRKSREGLSRIIPPAPQNTRHVQCSPPP